MEFPFLILKLTKDRRFFSSNSKEKDNHISIVYVIVEFLALRKIPKKDPDCIVINMYYKHNLAAVLVVPMVFITSVCAQVIFSTLCQAGQLKLQFKNMVTKIIM